MKKKSERIAEAVRVAETNLNAAIEAAHKAGLIVSVDVLEVQDFGDLFDMPLVYINLFTPVK